MEVYLDQLAGKNNKIYVCQAGADKRPMSPGDPISGPGMSPAPLPVDMSPAPDCMKFTF